jgi:hypothetical protein
MHDLFYGPAGEQTPARTEREQVCAVICATCPVRDRCAEQSTSEVGGYWAGRSRETAKATGVPDCGTQAGYSRHRRWKEDPCQACKTAHAHQKADRKAAMLPTVATDKTRRAELWADAS